MINTWTRANQILPGGNSLFSKHPDRYCPGQWPPYYDRADGIAIYTPDGKKYLDFSIMSAGTNTLGYCDPDVDNAVHEAIFKGNVSTLNCPEEVELAEMLLKLNPGMDMVRFGRGGNDACQIALRIAREYSGKQRFAICGYHGWEVGHPPQLDPFCYPFEYGNARPLEDVLPDIGAIIMEPVRSRPADIEFLNMVRQMADAFSIPLIFDEITSGFRCNPSGYYQKIGIVPDLVCYGKAMGNGYAISAVVGKETFMEKARGTFISSTPWSERIGYAAGIATLAKMDRTQAQKRMCAVGNAVKSAWREAGDGAGLDFEITGLDPLATFAFTDDPDRVRITTFTQEMLKRGYLASGQFYASIMHSGAEIKKYSAAVNEVFCDISSGRVKLVGEPALAGFRRLA
jgi:glutamate-1-semialdehyde aminotransferase